MSIKVLTYPDSRVEMKFKTKYESMNSELVIHSSLLCPGTIQGWRPRPWNQFAWGPSDPGLEMSTWSWPKSRSPLCLRVFTVKGCDTHIYPLGGL